MRVRALLFTLVALLAAVSPVAAPAGLPAASAKTGRPALAVRIAYTHDDNIWLMNGRGGGRVPVTTLGNNSITYPRYGWSHDGRYFLAMRRTIAHGGHISDALLLFDRGGILLRTLTAIPESAAFSPAWARDA